MKDFEIVYNFQRMETGLGNYGHTVSAIKNGFYIHNKKGTIVATCTSVDGLNAYLQALQNYEAAEALEDN